MEKEKHTIGPDALKKAFDFLVQLHGLSETSRKKAWEQLRSEISAGKMHLLGNIEDKGFNENFQLLMEQERGVLELSYYPDNGIPWLIRQAETKTENVLFAIDGQPVSFRAAFHWLRLTGQLEGLFRHMVDAALLWQLMPSLDVRLTEEELQKAVDAFRASQGLYSAEDTRRWLERNQLRVSDIRDFCARLLVFKKIKNKVTENRIEAYFREHHQELDRALLLVVAFREKEAASMFITAVEEAPMRWATLLSKFKPVSQKKGEEIDLQWMARHDLPEKIAEQIFKNHNRFTFGPAEAAKQWKVFLVFDVKEATLDEEQAEFIRTALFEDWLVEKRKEHPPIWFWHSQQP